ncbi:2-amino-4-hydroxy-6-hydroxymethyldihydropteridine diphosphokinase [Tamlana sp. 2_MG-2023]|uniref:2-amino-4-hydroxy-6- hydroxymethyldihydropteridine diphosphokinase n=1 Tax=unclassified Tamlana TaxID=2614803 RepID=UPI0026E1F7E2|nr:MULTISPECIES: 2-amino-4-hydroxy-6-hydroxymethyldihydropteridine diphosphokinase [unclassified Tamlana]MDO6760993.1 2-amino-4-hydroxy-6-hydroxymethyldihydropteridine diphosphokinase [Tamlana sp. 2_MG-2023]MDO6791674.1 2-amino-4-hydroxy-6-hydroxymethyldihydropteridine diphosphokinase [Tamlana sp. 1_MG-2023]
MQKSMTYYIALGSNKGDKFKNLQAAIQAIYEQIGYVVCISKVYKSPAFGFESDDFLNCCLALKSVLEPQEVLELLLKIEIDLGRVRTQKSGYEARVIDLDIVLAEAEIISTETLQLPHPEMAKRKFVLLPLNDIAAHEEHPVLKTKIAELLEACPDDSVLEALEMRLENPSKKFELSKYNYLAIEGNIGSGKTSLATKISEDFNAKLVLERYADNPFLPKFYEDAHRYAFTLEMSFLADRYQQISDDLSQLDLFKDFIVSDYDVFKSLIFSKITLAEDEFNLYRKLFYLMYKELRKPDLYVYLHQNTERLQQNIKKRGRDYEQNIQNDYLEKINAGYLEFLKTQTDFNVKIIDVSNRDFVGNRADYLWVLEQIASC